MEANRYNEDLKETINRINKTIDTNSNFEKEELKTLLKAYQIKSYNKLLEKNKEESKKDNKEVKVLERKPTFQKIAPKIVDYEFKGNPEEKRNNKVLVRRK